MYGHAGASSSPNQKHPEQRICQEFPADPAGHQTKRQLTAKAAPTRLASRWLHAARDWPSLCHGKRNASKCFHRPGFFGAARNFPLVGRTQRSFAKGLPASTKSRSNLGKCHAHQCLQCTQCENHCWDTICELDKVRLCCRPGLLECSH